MNAAEYAKHRGISKMRVSQYIAQGKISATKIGRGELFEAIEALGFLRVNVLGPLILDKQGARPQGLRKIERHATIEQQDMLKRTLAGYDAGECLQALHVAIDLYRVLKTTTGNPLLEQQVLDYLQTIKHKKEG